MSNKSKQQKKQKAVAITVVAMMVITSITAGLSVLASLF